MGEGGVRPPIRTPPAAWRTCFPAPELLRRLRAERPETKILLMSGYSQEAVFQNEIVDPSTEFLATPVSIRQLTQRVREVLDAPARSAPVGQRAGSPD